MNRAMSSICFQVTLPTFSLFGAPGALGDARRFLQKVRRRGRLQDESEALVLEDRDHHGDDHAFFHLARLLVELPDELP